ncbi:MAG: LysM repeat protein [Chitinophagales bacterium]|jgi:LysM repeat protein
MKYATLLFICFGLSSFGQDRMTNQEYIDKYYPIAVRKMVEYKIPASITLAQGILESGSGNSKLALNAKNHFGIKCHSDWTGKGYYMDDDTADECFRVYNSPEESFADHSKFLTSRSRYMFLFTEFSIDDYEGWAKGLKEAGYATNPKYPQLLISLIERNDLSQYDRMGLKDIKDSPPIADIGVSENDPSVLPKNAYYVDDKKDVFIYNRTKTIISNGRQILEVANEFSIDLDKLMAYNDIHKGYSFTEDQFIYLQPKRNKGAEKTHTVEVGQTMWEISQLYGIKLTKLYKKNRMVFDRQAKPEETVYMKKKSENAPRTFSYSDVLDEKNKIKEKIEAEVKAKLEAEKKAAEVAAKKKLEAELAAQRAEAAKQALEELEKRKVAAAQLEMEAQQQKEQFDAEQHPPIEAEDEVEKADPEEVEIEKPYVETSVKSYTVKVGDTLYSLSNRFYVTVEQLKELNNLEDNNLRVGQVLVVSP